MPSLDNIQTLKNTPLSYFIVFYNPPKVPKFEREICPAICDILFLIFPFECNQWDNH